MWKEERHDIVVIRAELWSLTILSPRKIFPFGYDFKILVYSPGSLCGSFSSRAQATTGRWLQLTHSMVRVNIDVPGISSARSYGAPQLPLPLYFSTITKHTGCVCVVGEIFLKSKSMASTPAGTSIPQSSLVR